MITSEYVASTHPSVTAGTTTVVVTGAAGTLGRAVAGVFGSAGANLVLIDRDQSALERAFGNESSNRLLYTANLNELSEAAAVVELAVQRFGAVDVLCNIAGGFHAGEPVHALSDAIWNFLLDTNARTVIQMARAVVPGMLTARRGKIINVGALAAQSGIPNMAAYCASKGVVMRLTEAMSAELRGHNVNVNAVLPGIIDTPQNRKDMPDADFSTWVRPEDLAKVIAFLASEDARAIHGALLPVSGSG